MISVLIEPDQKIKYTFEFLLEGLEEKIKFNDLRNADLYIIYKKTPPSLEGKCLYIYFSDFWENYKSKNSLPKLPLKRFSYEHFKDLIALYFDSKTSQIVKEKSYKIILNLDIIASTFFMISRYEEYINSEMKDSYGRFPATATIGYKENFLHRPIVDEYKELLFFLLNKLKPDLKILKNKFKIFVTHDIDIFLLYNRFPLKSLIGDLVKRKSVKSFLKRIKNFLIVKKNYKLDPYWMFDYFLEKEKGLKNAYFFMTNAKSYNILDPKIKKLIEMLLRKNSEIGLHASINTFKNESKLKEEKAILEKMVGSQIYGVRQHYLMFDVKHTWQIQNKLGFKYDTSCGFPEYEGFRAGTSHSFKVYDLVEDRVLNLVEIPLIVMDVTLRYYRNLQISEALNIIKDLKEKCKKYGGIFTILWHNSFFHENEKWKVVYEESLK